MDKQIAGVQANSVSGVFSVDQQPARRGRRRQQEEIASVGRTLLSAAVGVAVGVDFVVDFACCSRSCRRRHLQAWSGAGSAPAPCIRDARNSPFCLRSPPATIDSAPCRTPTLPRSTAAARLLRAGRLVAFPTETVYGLGANALDPEAVARIYAVKGRPPTSPLIVHVASIEMAKSLVTNWSPVPPNWLARFLAGPTDAGPRKAADDSTLIVTAGLPTVGLRMPAHPIALALINAAGVPLAAPSANRFTQLVSDHRRPRSPGTRR